MGNCKSAAGTVTKASYVAYIVECRVSIYEELLVTIMA